MLLKIWRIVGNLLRLDATPENLWYRSKKLGVHGHV
jgi:hypothetical protein